LPGGSRGLGDVYKRQETPTIPFLKHLLGLVVL
jgi:hypothetical protein